MGCSRLGGPGPAVDGILVVRLKRECKNPMSENGHVGKRVHMQDIRLRNTNGQRIASLDTQAQALRKNRLKTTQPKNVNPKPCVLSHSLMLQLV